MISRRQFLLRSAATGAGLATSASLAAAGRSKINVSPLCNGYARLFPARPPSEADSPFEKALRKLALSMRGDKNSITGEIVAGYTYLGQFIDHDLTLDITPLDGARKDPQLITNFRTPFLDLDQLYEGGPNISPFLYRKHGSDSPEGEERFLLGATKAGIAPKKSLGEPDKMLASSCNDLPRNSQGIALAADARQDENLILAQLHVAFLKLHNLVLKQRDLLGGSPHYNLEPRFEAVRRVVTWHYQWIVRNDFLKRILNPKVFDRLGNYDDKPLLDGSAKNFRIPVEFSAAAFRFGHSMVRNEYFYNDFHDSPPARLLDELFQQTGFGKAGNVPLPQHWVIKWPRFFVDETSPFEAQPAQLIDTKIADGLFQLLPDQKRAFSMVSTSKSTFAATDPPELPVRTLLRGGRMGLPSGEQVAAEVARRMPGVRLAKEEDIIEGDGKAILTDPKNGLRGNTPLWYYVLKEAEVLEKGYRLGPVGSRIVGDVIVAALAADPASYINVAGPNWTPTLWAPNDPQEDKMMKLLRLVDPDQITTECNST